MKPNKSHYIDVWKTRRYASFGVRNKRSERYNEVIDFQSYLEKKECTQIEEKEISSKIKHEQDLTDEDFLRKIEEISNRYKNNMIKNMQSSDHSELLYNDDGLPS